MASVKGVSFTCPKCAKVLRASARPPAGKKIKCPACANAFVPDLDEEEAATAIKPESSPKAKPRPKFDADEDADEKPRNKKSRADDDDDDQDDEDRSIKKKKGKKKGGSMMMIILAVVFLGGGGLLGCGACGFGIYYFWPGQNNELMAFVAPDANMIAGGRPRELKAKFGNFKDLFNKAAGPGGVDNWQEMEDLVFNSEQVLIFGNTNQLAMGGGPNTSPFAVIKADAADIERFRKSNRLEAAKTVGGYAIHKVKPDPNFALKEPGRVAIHGRIVAFSDRDENQIVAMLDRGKKTPAKTAAVDLARSVERSPLWAVYTFDADTRKKLREGFDMAGKQVPAMQAAAPAVNDMNGGSFTLDVVPGDDIKLSVNLMCKDAGDATKVKTGLEDGWKVAKGALDAIMMFGGAPQGPGAKAQQLAIRDLGNLSFNTQGTSASASLTFKNETIQEMAKLQDLPPGMFGGVGPGPGPGGIKKGKGPDPKAPKTTVFTTPNFAEGQTRDRVFTFARGTPVRMDVHAASATKAVVEVSVLEGAAGEKALMTNNQPGPVRQVQFNVPVTGVYRVRVRNLGPGVVPSCAVFVMEN